MRTTLIAILCLLLSATVAWSQESDTSGTPTIRFALEALPSAQIPVGALGGIVRPTAGFSFGTEVMLTALPWLSAGVSLGYAPAVVAGNDWLHTILGGAMAQVTFPILPFLEIGGAVGGGYEYSILVSGQSTFPGGGTYLEIRAAARYILLSRFSIGIFAGYRHLFGITGAVQAGATARLVLGR